jgi:hypothetical protein
MASDEGSYEEVMKNEEEDWQLPVDQLRIGSGSVNPAPVLDPAQSATLSLQPSLRPASFFYCWSWKYKVQVK